MKNNTRGFTMVEMVTVIGVILILVALLLPVLRTVRNNATKTKVQAMIQTLSVALKAYETDWGCFPSVAGITLCPASPTLAQRQAASRVLYFCLNTAFRAGVSTTAPTGASSGTITPSKTAGPYLDLTSKDYTGTGAGIYVVDAWGQPFAYNYDSDYNPATTPPSHNTSSFDLWSVGADGTTGNSDDVYNW